METEKLFAKRNIYILLNAFAAGFVVLGLYLSWVYHLAEISSTWSGQIVSGVVGYTFQAAGVLSCTMLLKKRKKADFSAFAIGFTFFLVFLPIIPALFSKTITGTFLYGFIMNLFLGIVMGFNLYTLTFIGNKKHRGVIFAIGYSLALLLIFAVSYFPENALMRSTVALVIYGTFLVLCAFLNASLLLNHTKPEKDGKYSVGKWIVILTLVVVLISAALNFVSEFFEGRELIWRLIMYFVMESWIIIRTLFYVDISNADSGYENWFALGWVFGRIGDAIGIACSIYLVNL